MLLDHANLSAYLLGSVGGLRGEVLHLARNHREALTSLTGTSGLDRGVQSQKVFSAVSKVDVYKSADFRRLLTAYKVLESTLRSEDEEE